MASEKISILVTLNDKASPGLKNLSSKFKTFSSKTLAAATKAMKAFGIVAAVALGAGVKKAAEFEQQMSDVSTLITGDSTVAIDELSSGIMDLIKVVPKSANDLGAASYQIFSAGVTDSADALTVLEAAAKLGTAGLGTTGEAADLLTSAINAFGADAQDADKIADIFFKTVKAGKTTIADLAGGFGSVGPVAAQLGIDLDELQAATAALTTVGLPTTEAQTQLTAVMKALIKPNTEMES